MISNNVIVKNKNVNVIKLYLKFRIEDIKNIVFKLIYSVNIYVIWFLCLFVMVVWFIKEISVKFLVIVI